MNKEHPGAAKRFGCTFPTRPDWDTVKIAVMREILEIKFSDEILRNLLIDTHPHSLVEGNTWGDTFWGVCNGNGKNHLGILLMELRDRLSGKGLWLY